MCGRKRMRKRIHQALFDSLGKMRTFTQSEVDQLNVSLPKAWIKP